MLKRFVVTVVLSFSAVSATAGDLKEGVWIPSACGSRQEPPVVDVTTIDSYNASVKALNEWQRAIKVYDDCLVKEANTDSAVIANTAKAEQGALKAIVDKLNNDLDAARATLEQKPIDAR